MLELGLCRGAPLCSGVKVPSLDPLPLLSAYHWLHWFRVRMNRIPRICRLTPAAVRDLPRLLSPRLSVGESTTFASDSVANQARRRSLALR